MPRIPVKAPNATVKMSKHISERRKVELEYDKEFPEYKHMWYDPDSRELADVVKSGLVEVVKDKAGELISNRMSCLCRMSRETWENMAKAQDEASYEEVKAIRGNFDEFDVPLRQFANLKTPRKKE